MPQLLLAASQRVSRLESQRRRRFFPALETLEDRTLLNAGMLDPTFGTGGQVITPIANSGASGLVLQPDGKLVAGGSSGSNLVLERYNADGTPDASFGTAGQVNANMGLSGVVRLALQADGKILVSGNAGDLIQNNLKMVVARYLPNGTLDVTFGTGGETTIGPGLQADQIAVQGDGKILLAGITQASGITIHALVVARLNTDGTVDTAFGINGQASAYISGDVVPIPRGLGIEPNHRIVVATGFDLVGFTPQGTVDSGFGQTGGVSKAPTTVSIEGQTILSDGRIVVVGSAQGPASNSNFAILRFFANGNLDNSFGNNEGPLTGFAQSDQAIAVAVQSDGRYVAAGSTGFADVSAFALARYNPNGGLDTSFGTDGKATAFPTIMTQADQVVIQADGRAVAAGSAQGGGFALARFTSDTPLPTANQRFVAQAYLDLLGRPVDGVGLTQWSNLLDQGSSRTQAALDIEASPEFESHTVEALYAQYLHRIADPGGLSNSMNFLRSGGTIEQLIDILVSSPEFLQGQGMGTSDGFLNALYQDALDRAVDPGGRAAWKQALANGASFAQVTAAILASTEYRQYVVTEAYGLFLRRQPESAGLNAFTAELAQGMRDEQVFAQIVGSQEYFQRI